MKINFKVGQLNEGKFQVEGLNIELDYHVNEMIEAVETVIEIVTKTAKEVK